MNITLRNACELICPEYKHILEFGVYKGNTIKQLRNFFSDSYEVFGFDSFEGLPEDWVGTNHKKGDMSVSGVIPRIENVFFYKGWFKDTIPQYMKIAKPIGLLHVDCDLYSSTIDILFNLNDYIKVGTIIVFDEWSIFHNEHTIGDEQTAFYEWVEKDNRDFELLDRINDYNEIERQIVIIKN